MTQFNEIVDIRAQDFLNRICPDAKSHITQSLSKLPEYNNCSSALNRRDMTEPLNIATQQKILRFVHKFHLLMMNQLFRIAIINCNRWILMLKSSKLQLTN